jgi:hypothetical protein
LTPQQLKAAVEEELLEFDTEFQSLGNSPVMAYEKAILRTYLLLRLAKKEDDQAAAPEGAAAVPGQGPTST